MKLRRLTLAMTLTIAGGLSVATTACDSDDSGGGDTVATDTTQGDTAQGDAAQGDTGPVTDPALCDELPGGLISDSPSGTWAMVQEQHSLVDVFGLGLIEQFTHSWYLVEHSGTGDSVTATMTMCDWLTDDTTNIARTVMSDATRDVMPVLVRDVTIDDKGDATFYNLSHQIELRAVTLDDPANEELPTSAEDPRVIDLDSDGNPGFTYLLSGVYQGSLHVIQRHTTEMRGVYVSATRVEGLFDWLSEQVILSTVPENLKELSPDPQRSADDCRQRFIMVKMPDDATCQDVRDGKDTLFE